MRASGCYFHILAATFGLSAILATSSTAFTVIKYAGAAYLVYLGLTLLRSRRVSPQSFGAVPPASLRTVLARGFLTSALNPKVALFFLAFVPQFIEPSASHKAAAFLTLGVIFSFTGTLWCLFLAWVTARVGSFGASRRVGTWLNRAAGAIFVFLGAHLALSRPG